MQSRVEKPTIEVNDYALSTSKGGTGGMTVPEAVANLQYVQLSSLGVNGGIAQLDANGVLPSSVLPSAMPFGSSVTIGPSGVAVGGVATQFVITNYNSFQTYTVTTTSGAVSVSGDVITYTPTNVAGTGGFVVNGESFTVQITAATPVTPSIVTPVSGATGVGATIAVTSSAFGVTGGSDTHLASHWQVSTSPAFSTLVSDSVDDAVNKVSWTSGTLLPSTTYYLRVRHKGTAYGYSQWSTVVSFSTKSSFIPGSELGKLLASDGVTSDYFGWSVSISSDGSTALIGAKAKSSYKGAAYVFTRSGSTWTQQAKLLASGGVANDSFGWSVSISSDGSTALIGAYGSTGSTGAAYVFTRSGSTWTQQAKLVASDGAGTDKFGISVSISSDGSTALIGAYGKSTNTGAAYVFTRSGSTWTQQAKLLASDGLTGDNFGCSVSISSDGSTALVGAYDKSPGGAAYVFTRSGSTWTQQAKLLASDGATSDFFGYSVSISSDGSTALIGAYGSTGSTGAAYVFTRSGSTWTQQAKLVASDGSGGDYFGMSVSISSDGSTALIGAYGKSSGTGASYVFTRSGSTWTQQAKLLASDGATSDLFGSAVSISSDGSTALIGAYGSTGSTGAAYVYG